MQQSYTNRWTWSEIHPSWQLPDKKSGVLRLSGVASVSESSGIYLIQATSATSIRRHREASEWSGSTSAETGSTQDVSVAWHVVPTWWICRAAAPLDCSDILSPTPHSPQREIENTNGIENTGTKTERKILAKYSKQEIGKETTMKMNKSRRKLRKKELKERNKINNTERERENEFKKLINV
jgi:hypothetical protein